MAPCGGGQRRPRSGGRGSRKDTIPRASIDRPSTKVTRRRQAGRHDLLPQQQLLRTLVFLDTLQLFLYHRPYPQGGLPQHSSSNKRSQETEVDRGEQGLEERRRYSYVGAKAVPRQEHVARTPSSGVRERRLAT